MSFEGALPTKLVSVPHLGGTKVGYHLPKPVVGSKPTLVFINSFATSATLFRPQLTDADMLASLNLVAVEPLGHGSTTTVSPTFTYWDSAIAFLQALDALNIKKAFVYGSSQGGWIAARMALLAPTRIQGIISAGSHMDNAGPSMIQLGCKDFSEDLTPLLAASASEDANFALPDDFVAALAGLSLGPNAAEADTKLFSALMAKTYAGDAGRLKFRQAVINLLSRDSLHLRLDALTMPVLWIRGSEDPVFTEAAVKEDIATFKNADVATETIQEGHHVPSWTHAKEVNPILTTFVKKYGGVKDARALREMVGMVDI